MLSECQTLNIKGIEMAERVLFTWSGGKDSAMALYELQKASPTEDFYEESGC